MQHSRLESPLPEALHNATEGEMADWRYGDEDEALARFEQALENGSLEMMRGDSRAEAQAATIYLTPHDMELARRQAKSQGMETTAFLEAVVRKAIHEKTAA